MGNFFFDFLDPIKQAPALSTSYTHRIIQFSKTLISNHFLLELWISKKNVKTYLYVKKSQLFEKNTMFPIAMQEST